MRADLLGEPAQPASAERTIVTAVAGRTIDISGGRSGQRETRRSHPLRFERSRIHLVLRRRLPASAFDMAAIARRVSSTTS